MTGSPLLTLPETFPDSSFQHSTSTQKVPASTNSWVWGSKRRAVEAMRKLVTAPFSRLTRRGESTTLPTTVTWVSFTVLLRGLSAWSGGPGSVPAHRGPWAAVDPRAVPESDLWTGP